MKRKITTVRLFICTINKTIKIGQKEFILGYAIKHYTVPCTH